MQTTDWLAQSNIAIVKHTYTPTGGAEQELLRYVLPRAKSITYISHPFAEARGVPLNTKISVFEDGELKDEMLAPLVRGPFPLMAAKDVLYTLWYIRGRRQRFHMYVGVDNLNAFSGVLLRLLGPVDRVVYYVIDYAPGRFPSRPMQSLYRLLDRRCCYHSDVVWNVSAAIEVARRSDGMDVSRSAPQIEVPLGNRFEQIPKPPSDKRKQGLIVFLGSLTGEQGLNLMLEALPAIRKVVPHAALRVVGDGPDRSRLERLAEEKGIQGLVEFLGFVEDDARAAELVAEASVAVAPYLRTEGTYKRFADPGKVKIYLAAGLPVIISRVPPVADLIEAAGAGVAINPAADDLANAVTAILTSSEKIEQMRANALELGRKFDWTGIFDRAFERTLALWEEKD